MLGRNVLILFVFGVLCFAYGQRDIKFFRKDYKYLDNSRSFYKVQSLQKNWWDAKKVCAAEGATLFYPETSDEAADVLKLIKERRVSKAVYIGVSDVMAPGVYETVDGVPLDDIYNNWVPGDPTGINPQNCVVLNSALELKEEDCSSRFPFVCKKTLDSLEWNNACSMPNMDYVYDNATGKCYKFHLDPQNWTEAYSTCAAEQSYLAIINSQTEANELKRITAEAPKDNVQGDYLRGAVHLGFHNRFGDGWQTIKGVPLAQSGYDKWSPNQPDGKGLEKCGSMFYDAELNDIGCHWRMFFICEHDVEPSTVSIDPRFNDIET